MDYFLYYPFTLLLLIFLASSYFLFKRRKSTKNLRNLPPGSFGWPVIGETLEFLSESPENFILQRLKKHKTQVFKTNILGENTVFFSGQDANKFITTNEQKLVRVWFPHSQQHLFGVGKNNSSQNNNIQQKSPPGIARLYGFFKPETKFVENFDSLMKQQLSKYCEFKENEVIRAYQLIKSFALTLSCNYLLGMEPERAAKLAGKFDNVVNGIQSIHLDFPGTVFHRAKKAAAEVRREIELLIKEKTEVAATAAEEDLLSIFVAGDQSGKVKLPSTVANLVMGIMAASYGSLVTTMTFMVKFVGQRPDVYEKIYSGNFTINYIYTYSLSSLELSFVLGDMHISNVYFFFNSHSFT